MKFIDFANYSKYFDLFCYKMIRWYRRFMDRAD